MTDPDGRARQRGRGFPVLNLPRATEAVREVVKYGLRQTRGAFAERLGHQTADSGPFRQKLAAFREFGLVTSGGAEIEFTDLGQQVAIPLDADAERAALQVAFFKCELFAGLFEVCAKESDLALKSIAATAFHQFQVAASSRDACALSFAESAVFAGLGELSASGDLRLSLANVRDAAQEVGRIAPSGTDRGSDGRADTRHGYGTDISIRHPLNGGEVAFSVRLEQSLPAATFGLLQSAVEAVDQLATSLNAVGEVSSVASISEDDR